VNPASPLRLELSRRAARDLRKLERRDVERVRDALSGLRQGAANLDIKPLRGSAPWLRLRVGELRVLYRPLSDHEAAAGAAGWLIARVIPRGELDRAVASLDT
jgi:mRNA-degrading endonuclease RelE of RelBE toxin-antitoxin system